MKSNNTCTRVLREFYKFAKCFSVGSVHTVLEQSQSKREKRARLPMNEQHERDLPASERENGF